MRNLLVNPNGSVTLCARKTCCPVLDKVGDNLYRVTDDDRNSVVLTREQADDCLKSGALTPLGDGLFRLVFGDGCITATLEQLELIMDGINAIENR